MACRIGRRLLTDVEESGLNMDAPIESMFQEIGQMAVHSAQGLNGRLLVYAEAQEGVISADLFYVNEIGIVKFRFCSEALRALIYSFWERWREELGNSQWRTMAYVVDDGKIHIDLLYPDQVDTKQGLPHRRPGAIKKYFGEMKGDYYYPE